MNHCQDSDSPSSIRECHRGFFSVAQENKLCFVCRVVSNGLDTSQPGNTADRPPGEPGL